jgi:GT2 family glycosyltransferase
MEEIDLCWRLKRLGYSFHAIGTSRVYHLGGGTLQYMSPRKTFLNFRNSLFMITKNHEGLLFMKFFKRMVLDGLATLRFIRSGQWKHFLALLQAHISFYRNVSKMLRKRKTFREKFSKSLQYNQVGLYQKSIIQDRFLRGHSKFSELNPKDFL